MKISKMVDALQYIDEDLVAEAITYRPDEKTMDEIIKISEGNGEEKAMRKKGKIAKRTLLVAALIAVLVLGTLTVAVAAFRGSLSEGLKNMFHISEDQEEDLLGREELPELAQGVEHLMVTPRDIDGQVADLSKVIGFGINLALHDGLTVEDVELFLS